MAQKSLYTPELFEEVCARYETGTPLVKVCKEMRIPRSSFQTWIYKDEAHEERFRRAKKSAALMIFEEAKEILDKLKDFAKPKDLDAKAYSAWVRAQEVSATGKMKIAAVQDPDYSEKHHVITQSENVVYVVSFGSQGDQQNIVDVKATQPKLKGNAKRAALPAPENQTTERTNE